MRRHLQATTIAGAISRVSDTIDRARQPRQFASVLVRIAKMSSWRSREERCAFSNEGAHHAFQVGSSRHKLSFASEIRRVLRNSEDPRFVMEEVLICARYLEVESCSNGRRWYSVTITQERWETRVRIGPLTDKGGLDFHSDHQPQRRQAQSCTGGLVRSAPTVPPASSRPPKKKSSKKECRPAALPRVRSRSVKGNRLSKKPAIRHPKG